MRKGFLAFGLVCGCLGLASGGPAFGDNWPRFRGPNGTGIAADKDIPLKWSDSENVLWKVAIPGTGNSSPIVWGDRIFLESAPNGAERRLYCLNVADGKTLWSQAVSGKPAKTHKKNTLASSTPATDGERVYALFWDGNAVAVHAYDFNGKVVWKRELGGYLSQHGAGSSPVVYRGKVYVNDDQDLAPGHASRLVALDAKTGEVAWQADRLTHRACYSSPFLLEAPGEPAELILSSTGGIMGYDPDTGSEKWRFDWPRINPKKLRTVGSPISAQGVVLACSGDGGGDRHTIAIRKGIQGDVTDTNLAWSYKEPMPYVPTPLAWGDHFYLIRETNVASGVACVEIKTGKIVWSEKRLGMPVTASPILVNGKIYVIDEDGEGYVFEASPGGFKLLQKNTLGEGVMATPAVANGRLYIRGKEHLFCIGKVAGN